MAPWLISRSTTPTDTFAPGGWFSPGASFFAGGSIGKWLRRGKLDTAAASLP
jgi:hypothetical protein